MVDTSIIMQAARQPSVDLPGILQRSAESAAAIEALPFQQQALEQQVAAQASNQQFVEQQRQAQDALRKAGIIYSYATQLKSLPMAQRRTYLSSIPQETLQDLGFDPKSLTSLAIDDASIDTAISQLSPLVQASQGGGRSAAPAELQTFEALTEGLSEEEIEEAKRVRLGLGARAKGKKQVEIGGVPYILDQDAGTLEPVQVGEEDITAETVGRSKGIIRAEETGAIEDVKAAKKFVAEAAPRISAIESNIATYDEVIAAIDSGARTGAIVSRLPSINEASKTLDNLRIRLGLDVVSMASFGALSESEMNIALSSALPTNKEPAALRKWVVDKQNAQRKAAEALRDAVSFLNNGGTMAELIELGRPKKGTAKPANSGASTDEFEGFEIIE